MSSALAPIRTPTRDEAVLAALARFVTEAGLSPGARLPTERDLAERLQVSRSTVREALKRWEGLGIVDIRKGSGAYLRREVSPTSVHLALTLDAPDVAGLLHTLEVRRAIEGEAAALCAERASDAERDALAERLERLEAAFHATRGANAAEDWDFHQAILAASGNPLFGQIIAAMRDAFHRFWERPFDMADFAHASFPFHRTLFLAIARGDAAGARAETAKLLESVRQDVLRGAARRVHAGE